MKSKRIALTTTDHLIFIDSDKIIYCESDSNYTIVFLSDGEKVIVSKTLKDVEEILYAGIEPRFILQTETSLHDLYEPDFGYEYDNM